MGIKEGLVKVAGLLVSLCVGLSEATTFQYDSYDMYEDQNGTIYFLAKDKLLLIAGEIAIPIRYQDGESFYLNVATDSIHTLATDPSMNGLSPLSGYSIYVGDYNGDGRSDIYIHPQSSGNRLTAYLLYGNRSSSPTRVDDYSNIAGYSVVDLTPAIGDYNGDGKQDLFFKTVSGEEIPRFVYSDKTNENNSSPELGNVVGRTKFSASVTKGGSASISIPLTSPRGATGLIAPVSMHYDSQTSTGNMGRGWSISIGGAITRCKQEFPNDQPLTYTIADAYCFQGERLIAVSGSHGANGSLYRTQVDSGVLVESHGSYLGEPSYWSVHSSNGDVSYYGKTAASRLEHSDGTSVLKWSLSSKMMVSGAEYGVTYTTDATQGEQLATAIDYINQSASIEFEWDTRSNAFYGWRDGSRVTSRKRLSTVTMKADGEVQRVYKVHYAQDNRTNKPLVRAIQECSGEGSCLRPLTMDWESTNNLDGYSSAANYTRGLSEEYEIHSLLTADLNNDGFFDTLSIAKKNTNCYGMDQIFFAFDHCSDSPNTKISFKLANGNGEYTDVGSLGITSSDDVENPASYYFLDVNYDGYADVIEVNEDRIRTWFGYAAIGEGQNSFLAPVTFNFDSEEQQIQFSDVDGDGYPDLVTHKSDTKWAIFSKYRTRVYKGSGDGTFAQSHSIEFTPEYYSDKPATLTDYDGDGTKDFLFHNHGVDLDNVVASGEETWREKLDKYYLSGGITESSDNFQYKVIVYPVNHRSLSLGSSYELSVPFPNLPHYYQDITNDGVPDRIIEDDFKLYYYEGRGDGQFEATAVEVPLRYARSSTYEKHKQRACVYEEGEVCLHVKKNANGNVDVYDDVSQFSNPGVSSSYRTLQFDDINNDGYVDIIEHRPVENGGDVFVKYGSFHGFTTSNSLEGVPGSPDEENLRFVDIDGDGVQDLLSFSTDSGRIKTYVSRASHRPMLTSISDGFGNETSFTWSYMTDRSVYTKGEGERPVGEKDVVSNRRLVSSMSTPSSVDYYQYSGARQRNGRDGYLGFSHFVKTTERTSVTTPQSTEYQTRALVTVNFLHQNAPFIGKTEKVVTYNAVTDAESANEAVNFANPMASNLIPQYNSTIIGSQLTSVSNWRENQWASIDANGIEVIFLKKYITKQFDYKSQDRLLQQTEIEEILEKPQPDSFFARRARTIVRSGAEQNTQADSYKTEVITSYDYKFSNSLYGHHRDHLVERETTRHTEAGKETLVDGVDRTFDARNRLESRTTYAYSASQGLDAATTKSAVRTDYQYTSDSISTLYLKTVSSANRVPGETGYAAPRTTKTEYDSQHNYKYLTAQSNLAGTGGSASDQTVRYSDFDRFGNALTIRHANGTQTSREFDDFGKIEATTDNWGVTTRTQRYFCSDNSGSMGCPSNAFFAEKSTVAGGADRVQPVSFTFFDAKGREVGTAAQRQSGAWSIAKKEWDQYNRLVLETTPVSAFTHYSDVPTQGVYHKRYYYDLNDRIVMIEQDNSIESEMGVNRRTNEYTVSASAGGYEKLVIDGKDRERYEYFNAQGQLTSTRETYLAENDFGNTVSRVATINHFYDAKGRKLAIEYPGLDPDGLISASSRLRETYTYDDANGVYSEEIADKSMAEVTRRNIFGDVVEVTDANNVTTYFQYDALGRKASQLVGGVLSCWYYDLAQPSKYSGANSAIANGALDSVVTYDNGVRATCPAQTQVNEALTDTSITIAKDYVMNDKGGIKKEAVYAGQMAFVTNYEYDNHGRLTARTLPLVPGDNAASLSPVKVGIEYNNVTGYPTALTNGLTGSARVVYEENTDMDQFGNVVEKLIGNVSLTQSFDPATNRVSAIEAKVNTGTVVDYQYDFNVVGEIIGRTESVSERVEKFGYLDGFSRQVTNVWVKGLNESDSSYRSEETYVYDALGNIRRHRRNDAQNSASFDMDYNYSGKRLINVEGTFGSENFRENFSYDDNGNVTSLGYYTMEYNSRNLVSRVESTNRNDSTEYWYDENGTRYKRTANIGYVNTDTYMVGPYERIESNGVVEHRHYIGENTLVMTSDGGQRYRQNFIRDHIGSIVAVVDASGTVLQRKRYTLFGEEIETFTQSGIPQTLGITEKGFTDHEHIPGFQLVHMGGRLYHPRLGRFMQADITIQNTKAPVNYSRYAYVLNSPLGYTDPSGYLVKEVGTAIKNFFSGDEDSGSSNEDRYSSGTATDNDSTDAAPEEGIGNSAAANADNAGSEDESLLDPIESADSTQDEPGFFKQLWERVTYWHYEGRTERNGAHPTIEAVLTRRNGWIELPAEMSIFHDDRMMLRERKFIHPDGREAVFSKDLAASAEGLNNAEYLPVTNSNLRATYNYVTPVTKPTSMIDVGGWLEYAGKGIGHVLLDVVPYCLGNNDRNTGAGNC